MMAEHIANLEAINLQKYIKQVKRIYMHRGFKLVNILMDGQFECIRGDLDNIKVNLIICSNDEKMGEIERLNRTINEMARGIYKTIPFKKVPGCMIVERVALNFFLINYLPLYPSIVWDIIPQQIFTGMVAYYKKTFDYSSGNIPTSAKNTTTPYRPV